MSAVATMSPIAAAKGLAKSWADEAKRRRAMSRHDPIPEILDYCAAELVEKLKPFDDPTTLLTVDAYAELHDRTPQTVRNWINRGELEAREGPRGWLIPRSAVRKRRTVKR